MTPLALDNPWAGVGLICVGGVVAGTIAASTVGVAPAGLEPAVAAFFAVAVVIAVAGVLSDPAWALSGALVASVFSGHWYDIGAPFPLDRALFAVTLAALLLRAPLRRPHFPRPTRVHLVMFAAIMVPLMSSVVHGTLKDGPDRFALIDRFGLMPIAAFVLAPAVFRTEAQRRILLWCLTGTGLYLGVTALAETLNLTAFVWPRYINDPGVGYHFGRARGPLAEAGGLGMALWGCGVASVVLASLTHGRVVRSAIGAITVLCLLGLLFTETRAVWLSAIVTSIIVIAVSRELWRFAIPAAAFAVVITVAALGLVPGLAADVAERRGEQGPVWDRLNSNSAALRMVQDQPLFGHGWGRFGEESVPYYRLAADYPIRNVGEVHNVFLSNLAEIGLIGTSLWLLALFVAIGSGLRTLRGPPEQRAFQIALVAIAVNWVVSANFTPLTYLMPNLLLWSWAGVTWAAVRDAKS